MITYIIIGALALAGIVTLTSWNSKQNLKPTEIRENRTEKRINRINQEEQLLKLNVMSGYDGE